MFEVQMIIPLADNDGESFGPELFASYEATAVELLGGFTLYPASVLGGWRDGAGRDVRDSSRVYAFAIGSIAQGGAVVALARFSCALFRQDAIFIRYLGLAEIILPA
ncbi:MAG TPA: hypothetical protein VG734_26065 [Lacunisphaera sp.]|nr:hypothetical protein [Lacunisphaera sp.]